MENNNNNNRPWESVYGKAQAEPDATSNDQERRRGKGKEGWPLPDLSCLATYVGYVPCMSICLY
jgi:hypothetical protein